METLGYQGCVSTYQSTITLSDEYPLVQESSLTSKFKQKIQWRVLILILPLFLYSQFMRISYVWAKIMGLMVMKYRLSWYVVQLSLMVAYFLWIIHVLLIILHRKELVPHFRGRAHPQIQLNIWLQCNQQIVLTGSRIIFLGKFDESDSYIFSVSSQKLFRISIYSSLPEDAHDIGLFGGTSPGKPRYSYNPPCSQGPGFKNYTFTIYALSQPILQVLNYSDVRVSADDDGDGIVASTLIEAAKSICVAESEMWVTFELYKKVCVHVGITDCWESISMEFIIIWLWCVIRVDLISSRYKRLVWRNQIIIKTCRVSMCHMERAWKHLQIPFLNATHLKISCQDARMRCRTSWRWSVLHEIQNGLLSAAIPTGTSVPPACATWIRERNWTGKADRKRAGKKMI